jgi:hypothetical protein
VVISVILTISIYAWLIIRFVLGKGGFLPILILPSLSVAFYGYSVPGKRRRFIVLAMLCLSWLAVLIVYKLVL